MSTQGAGPSQPASAAPSRGPALTFAATRCVGRRRLAQRRTLEQWAAAPGPAARPRRLHLCARCATPASPAHPLPPPGWRRCIWCTRRRRTGGSRCACTSCWSPPGRWAPSKRSPSSCSPSSSEPFCRCCIVQAAACMLPGCWQRLAAASCAACSSCTGRGNTQPLPAASGNMPLAAGPHLT